MKIHELEQGTPEWFDVRKGKMTASHAQAIQAKGKGLDTYILELMLEYYSSAEKEQYTNEHLERGIELEEQARNIYELDKGVTVEQVGFIELDEHTGCSPDGFVKEDGGLEIKCPSDKNYFIFLLNRKIDSKYICQMQMQMLVSGKKWIDYMAYNPNFKESKVIMRVELDPVMQEKLKIGLANGKAQIEAIKEKMKNV